MREFENKDDLSIVQNQYEFYKNAIKDDLDIPNGVTVEDIDRYVQEAIKRDFSLVSKGEPVAFLDMLSLTRAAEFMGNWTSMDATKTIKLPFIALKKETVVEKGSRFETINVPNKPLFPIRRIKSIKNGKEVVDFVAIPQPIQVDLTYELIFVTQTQRELNEMDSKVLSIFREEFYYVDVLGHYMPVFLNETVDNSKKDELEGRRYFEHIYKLTCKGYIFNAMEIKRLSSLNKITVDIDVNRDNIPTQLFSPNPNEQCILFTFERFVNGLQAEMNIDYTFEYDNSSANMGVYYKINEQDVSLPFTVKKGDKIQIFHNIENNPKFKVRLCGKNKK